MTILDTPDQIEAYRLINLRYALKHEIIGVRFYGGRISVNQRIRREFGIKARKRTEVLAQYEAILRQKGLIE